MRESASFALASSLYTRSTGKPSPVSLIKNASATRPAISVSLKLCVKSASIAVRSRRVRFENSLSVAIESSDSISNERSLAARG